MSTTAPNEQLQLHSLRDLYLTRTVGQLLWAGTILAEGVKDLGGYAIFGGVYFLAAAFLLHGKLYRISRVPVAVTV